MISSQTPQDFDTPSTPSMKYQPRNVTTTLNYYNDKDGSTPAPIYVGKPETYIQPSDHKCVTIKDVRNSESDFSLDVVGFQFVNHKSLEKEFKDEKEIKSVYYGEIEGLLKKVTGASKICIFGHTIRRAGKSSLELSLSPSATNPLRGPVQRVHVDQSYKAARQYVELHLFPEASTLLKSRHQIINVWRPIKTISKDPLAIADARSVPDADLIPIKLIYPNREGENFAVKAGEGHKWYYLHKQTPEEVLLIKCFDSKLDGRARRVPHAAFVDDEYEGDEPRESIEIRALVFHEDDVE